MLKNTKALNRIILTCGLAILLGVGVSFFTDLFKTSKKKSIFDGSLITTQEKEKKLPLIVNCKYPIEGSLKFTSEVMTHQRIVDHLGLEKKLQTLIEKQLKHLNGYFNFQTYAKFKIIPKIGHKLEIQNTKKIPYPFELNIDNEFTDNLELYPSDFKGSVIQNGEGLQVKYTVDYPVTLCKQTQLPTPDKVTLILPKDPYLAYWFVPQEKRVELDFFGKKLITNPCAFKQMADLKSPSMYWYVWKPDAVRDNFQCIDFLNENNFVYNIEAEFHEKKIERSKWDLALLKNKEHINIAIMSGYLAAMPIEQAVTEAKEFLKNINQPKVKLNNDIYFKQDPGTLALFQLIKDLNILVEHEPWTLKNSGTSFYLSTQGRLKRSNKKTSIKMFLGPTVDYQTGEKHWEFLAKALNNSDLIFYSGHAAMGKTFGLESIKKFAQTDINFKDAPAYQLIAVLSCFSTAYYGPDIIEARSRHQKTTDMVLTAYEGFPFRLVSGLMQAIDYKLAGENISLEKSLKRFTGYNHFISIMRKD